MSNIITEVIEKHFKDTLVGNDREELNYVDVIYPAVEYMFGLHVCIEAIKYKNDSYTYLENRYKGNINFDKFVNTLENIKETCNKIHDNNKLLSVADELYVYVINIKQNVRKEIKEFKNKKM